MNVVREKWTNPFLSFFLLRCLSRRKRSNTFADVSLDVCATEGAARVDDTTLLSQSELDELLDLLPSNVNSDEGDSSKYLMDTDLSYPLLDLQVIHDDDLFLQMLLDTDSSSRSPSTVNELLFSDLFSPTSSSSSIPSCSVPRITNVDEFDAFLSELAVHLSSSRRELSTFVS